MARAKCSICNKTHTGRYAKYKAKKCAAQGEPNFAFEEGKKFIISYSGKVVVLSHYITIGGHKERYRLTIENKPEYWPGMYCRTTIQNWINNGTFVPTN